MVEDAHGTTQIASHRGGAALWPENSLTAFRNTAALAVEQVEFDLHLSRDGHLMVHHDATLERMTDGTGALAAKSVKELATLRIEGAGGGEDGRIPHFTDVLSVFAPGELIMRIELKGDARMHPYPGIEAKTAETLAATGMLERSVITSFLLGALTRFAPFAPTVPRLWLVSPVVLHQIGGIDAVLALAKGEGIGEIGLHVDDVDIPRIRAAKAQGIRLGAYGAHDEERIRKAFACALSVFTTDRPDLALRIREELRNASRG